MNKSHQKVAVHALIKNNDKYLVLHRSARNDYMPGKWDTPGGSTEFGEDPIKALEREVFEETTLEVEVGKPLYVYSFMSNAERHQFQIILECKLIGGEVVLNPEEHDKYLWVTLEESKDLKKIAFLESYYNSLT